MVLVPFPFTDLSGHKVRPALVLYASARGEDCILAFFTSQGSKKSSFDFSVSASARNGLKINSMIKLEKLATLQKKLVLGELGALEPAYLSAIDSKLKTLFRL